MSFRATFTARAKKFGGHFNGDSLVDTQQRVAQKAYSSSARRDYRFAQQDRNTLLRDKTDAHQRLAASKILMQAGARKELADTLTDHRLMLLSSTEPSDFGITSRKAVDLFNASLAKSGATAEARAFSDIARLLIHEEGANAGHRAARFRLDAVVAQAAQANPHLARALFHLGAMLLSQASVVQLPNGRFKAVLPQHTVDEIEAGNRQSNKLLRNATGRTFESLGQSLAMGRASAGIQLAKGNQLWARSDHELRATAASSVGYLVAASRPVLASAAALVAAPVAMGAAAAATGVAVGAMGAVAGLGVGAAGVAAGLAVGIAATAAAASPLWPTGVVFKDGLTGGPGLADRSRTAFVGAKSSSRFGKPMGEQMKGAKEAFGRVAEHIRAAARQAV